MIWLSRAVRSYLEIKGISVVIAKTGKECVEAIQQNQPDAVLMDYFLPDTDGSGSCAKFTPLTPDSGPHHDRCRNHRSGCACDEGSAEQFVAKPCELSVLLQLLGKVFENRRFVRRKWLRRNASCATSAIHFSRVGQHSPIGIIGKKHP